MNNRRNELNTQSTRLQGQRPSAAFANQPAKPAARQNPQVYNQQNGIAYRQSRTAPVRISPIRSSPAVNRVRPETSRLRPAPKKPKRPSVLYDFLLGLVIGFAVFGTAAIFVCRAIIEIFI